MITGTSEAESPSNGVLMQSKMTLDLKIVIPNIGSPVFRQPLRDVILSVDSIYALIFPSM